MKNKKITLVVNDYDKRATEAAERLLRWCADNDVAVVSDADSDVNACRSCANNGGSPRDFPAADCCESPCDLVVALGGDGTILRAVHECSSNDVPLLGIKFGRLGFLSGAPAEDLLEAVKTTLEGRAQIERRALLQVKAFSSGKVIGTHYALNEALLGRHTDSRVVSTKVRINRHTVYQLRGDGIIVATATGSTAYALSAGGPILSPESRAMALVPMASHTLISRAIVTAPKDLVCIHLPDPDRAGAVLSIDGKVVNNNRYPEHSNPPNAQALTHIEARISSEHWVSLVKTSKHLFFDTLASEFYHHEEQ